jgi:hypothetical protein
MNRENHGSYLTLPFTLCSMFIQSQINFDQSGLGPLLEQMGVDFISVMIALFLSMSSQSWTAGAADDLERSLYGFNIEFRSSLLLPHAMLEEIGNYVRIKI